VEFPFSGTWYFRFRILMFGMIGLFERCSIIVSQEGMRDATDATVGLGELNVESRDFGCFS
jgi:hypothetical protein